MLTETVLLSSAVKNVCKFLDAAKVRKHREPLARHSQKQGTKVLPQQGGLSTIGPRPACKPSASIKPWSFAIKSAMVRDQSEIP